MTHHKHRPEINAFYDDIEFYKRGGKKHKKAKHAPVNQNIIKIHIGADKLKSRYAQMNHTTRLQRNARPMANSPSVSLSSTFAVPNPIAYPSRHVEIGQNLIPNPPIERVEVGSSRGVPNFTSENPRGIESISSQPSRAIPSKLGGNHGGVAYQSPEAIRANEHSYEPEAEDYAFGSMNYFKPSGRDNIPLPHQAKHTIATPVDYFPNRGQDAVPVPIEIERMHERGRERGRSPSVRPSRPARDEDFLSPSQAKESHRREAISEGHARRNAQPAQPAPALPVRRNVSLVSPSPAGRIKKIDILSGFPSDYPVSEMRNQDKEASVSTDSFKHGGMKKHASIF